MVLADTSALFALAVDSDASHERAVERSRSMREKGVRVWTGTHVVQELWMLVYVRFGLGVADEVAVGVLAAGVDLIPFDAGDVVRALAIASQYADQDFSLADRISFVMLERLGRNRVWTYDRDFAVYRYGPDHGSAFTVVQ